MSDSATAIPTRDWMRPGARYTMAIEPPVVIRTAAFDWDYEIQVALPASYGAMPGKHYPVLWLTDGPLLLHLAVGVINTLVLGGLVPEMIVVGFGCASEAGAAEFARRRLTDFAPPGKSILFGGPAREFLSKLHPQDSPQRADDLLDFIVDELRPDLARTYRMSDDHGLLGHSGGGMFANYALFARPGAFRRFIIGSPSSNAADKATFRLEAAYAAANKDLKADLFFGAGEREFTQLVPAAWGLASASMLMAETLIVRQYPSLKVAARVFPGKDHYSVMPDLLAEGLRSVWADSIDPKSRPLG